MLFGGMKDSKTDGAHTINFPAHKDGAMSQARGKKGNFE